VPAQSEYVCPARTHHGPGPLDSVGGLALTLSAACAVVAPQGPGRHLRGRGGPHHGVAGLRSYFSYYHSARCHAGLDHNAPEPREVEPPEKGKLVAESMVGGLHHRYRRVS
jgi:hypothetical protein